MSKPMLAQIKRQPAYMKPDNFVKQFLAIMNIEK